jgi:DNA-binding NarL/FixJ family response regulator
MMQPAGGERPGGTVTRVLVVDDHRLVRAGLLSIFAGSADLDVVGEASDGAQSVALCDQLCPDLVLMDLQMPGMDGVEATRRITQRHPDVQVMVLTSFSEGDRVRSALDAGAVGYLLKDAEPEDLLYGIRAVVRGESPLDARAVRSMLQAPAPAHADELTDRERQVLELIAGGMTNKQIAQALAISESTVKAHVGRLFQRIGVGDRTSAALWAERRAHAADGAG